MKAKKDSAMAIVRDIEDAWEWEWIDTGLKLRTLPWEKANAIVERARALVRAERKRKEGKP